MEPEAIELTLPADREWHAVARLVLGGVADRMNLSFEDLDDLQLAVERLLVEAASQDTVTIRIDVVDHGVRVGVGPLVERTIADALQGPDAEPGELTLRRLFRSYGPDVQSATLSAHLCAMGTLMWATRGQE